MKKLYHLFLIVSLSMTFSIFSSEEETHKTTLSEKSSDSHDSREISQISQGSSLFTTAWYGTAKALGLTDTKTFFELYDTGTLEGDICNNNIEEPLNRLSKAIKERYKGKRRPVEDPINQAKIWKIFNITQELKTKTKKNFELSQVLAAEYNPLQSAALQTITQQHANVTQPQLAKERDEAIQLAHSIYAAKMGDILTFAAQTAANKRYLYQQAQDTTEFNLQSEEHYKTIKAYESLLQKLKIE